MFFQDFYSLMLLLSFFIAAASGASDVERVMRSTHEFANTLTSKLFVREPVSSFPIDLHLVDRSPLHPRQSEHGNLRTYLDQAWTARQVEKSVQTTAQCVVRGVWGTARSAGSELKCRGTFSSGNPNKVAVYRVNAGSESAMHFEVSGELVSASGTVYGEHLLLKSLHRKSAVGAGSQELDWEASRLFVDAFLSECAFGEDAAGVDLPISKKTQPPAVSKRLSFVGLPVPASLLRKGSVVSSDQSEEVLSFAQHFGSLSTQGRVQIALQDPSLSQSLHTLVSLQMKGEHYDHLGQLLAGLSMHLSLLPTDALSEQASLWLVLEKSLAEWGNDSPLSEGGLSNRSFMMTLGEVGGDMTDDEMSPTVMQNEYDNAFDTFKPEEEGEETEPEPASTEVGETSEEPSSSSLPSSSSSSHLNVVVPPQAPLSRTERNSLRNPLSPAPIQLPAPEGGVEGYLHLLRPSTGYGAEDLSAFLRFEDDEALHK